MFVFFFCRSVFSAFVNQMFLLADFSRPGTCTGEAILVSFGYWRRDAMSALTLWETKTKSDTGKRDEYKGIYVEESSEEKCAKELGDDPNHTRAMLRSIRFSKVHLQAQQRAERILRECKPY